VTALAPGYEVLGLLSRNQAMDVYDVWDSERDCRVVAKLVREDRAGKERLQRRLVNEGTLLTRLAHPHLVRGYELLDRPQPVLILETLTGVTLGHLIETRRRRLALTDVAFLGMQLCSALRYLHRRGVLHLDVKPGNIVCDEAGQAKLIDLSLARPPGEVSAGVGTRDYLAPEQATGGAVDAAADVWGIGTVLYEAATGRRAFEGDDEPRRYAQLEGPPPPISSLRRVPAAFAELVDRCLAPTPAGRPSVEEVSSALDRLVERGSG
jgi:eukaryotic-like serine/threonine-protein kinase